MSNAALLCVLADASQCFLRLAPYVDCDSSSARGLQAFAALTFVALVAGFPAVCTWAVVGTSDSRLMARVADWTSFLLAPVELRTAAHRALWVPIAFVRKFLFPALASLWPYGSGHGAGALPLLVFASLLVMLSVQVSSEASLSARLAVCLSLPLLTPRPLSIAQVGLSPYKHRDDNVLAVLCLLALEFNYFASVLAGAAPLPGINAVVLVLKAAVVLSGFALAGVKMARRRHRDRLRSAELELDSPAASAGGGAADDAGDALSSYMPPYSRSVSRHGPQPWCGSGADLQTPILRAESADSGL